MGGFDDLERILKKKALAKPAVEIVKATNNVKKAIADAEKINETDRVCAMPFVWDHGQAAWDSIRERVTRPGSSWKLRDLQAEALFSAEVATGLLGNLDVGEGKTLVTTLLPTILGTKNMVVLTTKSLQKEFWVEYDKYEKEFFVPPRNSISVVPYSILQSRKNADILYRINPDLIVADEAQHLKNTSSARTKRFLSYMKENPACKFVPLTGTFFSSSLLDVYHLALLALKFKSPLPNDMAHLTAWANCLDNDKEASDWEKAIFRRVMLAVGDYPSTNKQAMRKSFYKRFSSAEGVVTTFAPSDLPQLHIHKVSDIIVPDEIEDALDFILLNNETPDGEQVLVNEEDLSRLQSQISCGFIYKADWEAVGGYNEDWVMRRKTWKRELRDELANNSQDGYDTPFFIAAKLAQDIKKNPNIVNKSRLHWAYAYWSEVKHLPKPPTKAVWLSDFFLSYMDDLLSRNNKPTTYWAMSTELQSTLAERLFPKRFLAGSSIPEYGRGTYSGLFSINAFKAGVNLQAWNTAYILEPFVSPIIWQQLLGRLHRTGQTQPVHFHVMNHTSAFRKRLSNAIIASRWREDMEGIPQKLVHAEWHK